MCLLGWIFDVYFRHCLQNYEPLTKNECDVYDSKQC